MKITIDTSDAKLFSKLLAKVRKSAIPAATRNTLNSLAFEAQKNAKKLVEKDMVLRNNFTLQSIRVDKARGRNISTMQSVVGSIAGYMLTQEKGGTKRKKGRIGTPIPTSYSSGERTSYIRTKLPLPSNKLRNIVLESRKVRGRTRKQRNFIAIRRAVKTKKRHIFLQTGRTKGIFKVIGGKRKPRIKMVYDLSQTAVRIPANPWLRPTSLKAAKKAVTFHRRSLGFQINRVAKSFSKL